jgi:hypothetical protein
MNKRVLILIAAVCLASSAFSQDQAVKAQKPILVTAGSGLYYDATPLPADALGMFFGFLFNLRGEAYGSLQFRLSDMLLVGAEAGLAVISVDFTVGGATSSYVLFDIPVRAVATVDLTYITLQPYLGGLFLMSKSTPAGSASTFTFSPAFEAGARLILGKVSGLYAEAGYVLGATCFPRFGAGFQMAL